VYLETQSSQEQFQECPVCATRLPLEAGYCGKCGMELSIRENSPREFEPELKIRKEDNQENYSALMTLGSIYRVLGWLTLVIGILGGIAVGIWFVNGGNTLLGFLAFISFSLTASIVALPLLATNDLIRLVMDLAVDIRVGRDYLKDLAGHKN
jgi:hypothetical protein